MAYGRRNNYGEDDTPMSAADARRQYEEAMQGGGLQSLTVQKDHQGNATLLGFRIPKELLPAVETAIPNAILWLQRAGSEFSYDKALKIAERLKFKKAKAIATAAEYGVRWGLIGIKPITDAISNLKIYSRYRKVLFKEFEPVIKATGVDWKSNEVIRNAFGELHDDMVTNMKLLAADAFTLAPMIYVGVKDHRAAIKKRALGAKGEVLDQKAELEALREYNKREINRAKQKETARQEYVKFAKEERLTDEHGKLLNDEALGRLFEASYRKREHEEMHKQRSMYDLEFGHDHKKGEFAGEHIAFLGLSLGSQIIKTNLRETAERRAKGTNAWTMIKHLHEELEGQVLQQRDNDRESGSKADSVYISTENGRLPVKEYILEIFQQHERDRLYATTRTGARERQKLNPLGPALVEQLMPTVDLIAEYVCEGRLSAYALVNLVGDNKVIMHKAGGARSFVKKADVEKMIDGLLATMGTHEAINPEEFFANFADPALIQETLKTNLEKMQGKEKAFFAALFPDSLLEQAGMKKEEIIVCRKEAHRSLYDVMAASTLSVAAHDAAALKKIGLTEKEISDVQALAEKIEAGDTKAVQIAVDGRDKSVVAAVRTYGLKQQVENAGDGAGFWTRMVEKARGIPEMIAECRKQAENKDSVIDAAAEPRAGRMADMRESSGTPFADEHNLKEGEVSSLSARDRESRRRDAEPSEGITIGS